MNDANTSHKLIVRPDGEMFIVSGCPKDGYRVGRVQLQPLGEHRRSHQAVSAALAWEEPPMSICGAGIAPYIWCKLPLGHAGRCGITQEDGAS